MKRRDFLKKMAAGVALPYFVPAKALGFDGWTPPSERIVLAGIGLGPRGQFDLKQWVFGNKEVQFVAIADVLKFRREEVKGKVDAAYGTKDCMMYADFRDVLARPDVDAILCATGVRWHAGISVLAMRAGKDVYCEKPGCLTHQEGRAVMETARATGRIYQMGAQRLSEGPMTVLNELCMQGRLGEVKTAYVYLTPASFNGWDSVYLDRTHLPEEPLPPKDECDWDMWLGTCPWRPYNKKYTIGRFPQRFDFHLGPIPGWGSHTFAHAQTGMGLADTSAVKYPWMTRGGRNKNADDMPYTFANGKTIVQTTKGWPKGYGWCGVKYVGTEGWAMCGDGYTRPAVSNPHFLDDYDRLICEHVARTGHVMNHMQDFFNSIRSRRQPVANADLMYHSMVSCLGGNIAQWVYHDLSYDPKMERFDYEPANMFLSRPQRAGWQWI